MILDKRNGFSRAFRNWSIPAVARFGTKDVERLCRDPQIIRNRLKIAAVIFNAQQILQIQSEHGSFTHWFYEVLEGDTYPALQANISPRFRFMGRELCRMWLMATGRISMAEGDRYAPTGTAAYATEIGPTPSGAAPA